MHTWSSGPRPSAAGSLLLVTHVDEDAPNSRGPVHHTPSLSTPALRRLRILSWQHGAPDLQNRLPPAPPRAPGARDRWPGHSSIRASLGLSWAG